MGSKNKVIVTNEDGTKEEYFCMDIVSKRYGYSKEYLYNLARSGKVAKSGISVQYKKEIPKGLDGRTKQYRVTKEVNDKLVVDVTVTGVQGFIDFLRSVEKDMKTTDASIKTAMFRGKYKGYIITLEED